MSSDAPCTVPREHVDLAATKIQALYRGYHVRKQFDSNQPLRTQTYLKRDNTHNTSSPRIGYDQDTHQIPRCDADKAAARIQASFRGYMVRREKLLQSPENKFRQPRSHMSSGYSKPPNENKYPRQTVQGIGRDTTADDSEAIDERQINQADEAAIRIQAMYRGFRARKNLKGGEILPATAMQ